MSGSETSTSATPTRRFGRYEIRQMVGRSQASGAWLAYDPQVQQEVLIIVPRTAPTQVAEREAWMQELHSAARLKHPRLAVIEEVSRLDTWPFAIVARDKTVTLAERLQANGSFTPLEAANIVCDLLEGLAYAHEAGRAHHDIAPHHVLLDKNGRATLSGLGSGLLRPQAGPPGAATLNIQQSQRGAAERDLLMIGLLLYRMLANAWPLDDHDLGHAADRVGPEIVRLPFATPHQVPDTLRAIVNRSTDRQQRQRYLNARTLLSALQGWIKTNAQEGAGPLVLLLDRLNTVGTLPGRPNTERALIGALSQESMRVDDYVDVVLKNPAMVWEMMRAVNSASYRSGSSDEGVTTVSRAVLFLGQQGVRKLTQAVRTWPGVLSAKLTNDPEFGAQAVAALDAELRQCTLAGHIARWMAPFELSDEECALTAMAQRLGWLLVLYHFPDEASQIKRLMQSGPPLEAGGKPTPGMSLEGAAGAVMGINLDDLTQAVLRHWGWEERLVQAARPLATAGGVRTPMSDDETLRTVVTLANELANTQAMPMDKAVSALHQIQLRYARALHLEAKECQLTLEHALKLIDRPVQAGASGASEPRPALRPTPAETSPAPLMPAGTLPSQAEGSSLRARLQSRR